MLDEAFAERQEIFRRIGRTKEADELEVAYSETGDVGVKDRRPHPFYHNEAPVEDYDCVRQVS